MEKPPPPKKKFISREIETYENANKIKYNKEAVGGARRIVQQCQLPERNFYDI